MKNFVLFFEEKEGSTAVVQTLDSLGPVSVVRRMTDGGLGGWEPFEWFNCGSLGQRRFRECLRLIFGVRPVNMRLLNDVYMTTARAPLRDFDGQGSVGFKMRIAPPWDLPNLAADSAFRKNRGVDMLCKLLRRVGRNSFRTLMAESLRELNTVVFVMVRQNIFRWAISKYHGDGTGKPGHLQFRLASGDATEVGLPKITIERERFERILERCAELHRTKRWWLDSMNDAGVSAHALRYEDFAEDRVNFFAQVSSSLNLPISTAEIATKVASGTRLKRVHGTDISDYVVNHEEIIDSFGDRFIRW